MGIISWLVLALHMPATATAMDKDHQINQNNLKHNDMDINPNNKIILNNITQEWYDTPSFDTQTMTGFRPEVCL